MGVPYAEVIGDPTSHSKSPLIHKFWLERLGVAGDYRATRVAPQDLSRYFADRQADPDWRGSNVTMPLKTLVPLHLLEAGDEVRRLGAANCVVKLRDALRGANFDTEAILNTLVVSNWSGHAVILGSGGAARAALWAFERLGFDTITVMSRDVTKAATMIESLGSNAKAALISRSPRCDFLINATPLGMTGHPPLNIELSEMSADGTVFDMVYDPLETPLLAAARRRGLAVIDGLAPLIAQAAMSFGAFFRESPTLELRSEVRDILIQ